MRNIFLFIHWTSCGPQARPLEIENDHTVTQIRKHFFLLKSNLCWFWYTMYMNVYYMRTKFSLNPFSGFSVKEEQTNFRVYYISGMLQDYFSLMQFIKKNQSYKISLIAEITINIKGILLDTKSANTKDYPIAPNKQISFIRDRPIVFE